MSNIDEIIEHTREWLLNDQYEYGEFGKHEIVNPTNLPRTYEQSLMKPNIFSSIYAYYTLVSTGEVPEETISLFETWINKIRSEEGYWTSASGAVMPFGNRNGWARNNNLRHTAKCLDYYFLCGKFVYQDAEIFCSIISNQLENGAYPQFVGGQPDIWSTAYFVNLLIRASMDINIPLTRPRGKNDLSWKNDLSIRLDRAINWLIMQLNAQDNLWHIEGGNPITISLAMMVEIGGYLAIHKTEQCKEIVETLLDRSDYNYSMLYVGLLTIDTIQEDKQKRILSIFEDKISEFNKDIPFSDLVEATSLCKISANMDDIGAITYYRNISNGHESLLISASSWDKNQYFKWCIKQFVSGKTVCINNPIQECDFWQQVKTYILKVKDNIENNRGWQLLWDDVSPSDEETVQVYFDNQLRAFCGNEKALVSREVETGRGPVDFTFSNGFTHRELIEIKLVSNQALRNGNFCAQIYEYLKGIDEKSAFLVVLGFYDNDKKIMSKVKANIEEFNSDYPDYFIYPIYISAEKRNGASKTALTDLKKSNSNE